MDMAQMLISISEDRHWHRQPRKPEMHCKVQVSKHSVSWGLFLPHPCYTIFVVKKKRQQKTETSRWHHEYLKFEGKSPFLLLLHLDSVLLHLFSQLFHMFLITLLFLFHQLLSLILHLLQHFCVSLCSLSFHTFHCKGKGRKNVLGLPCWPPLPCTLPFIMAADWIGSHKISVSGLIDAPLFSFSSLNMPGYLNF